MNLVLEIVNDLAYEIGEKSMRFNNEGGNIGRSKNATWALRDPSKNMSNFHANITFTNGQYFLTDISTNGTFWKTPYKKFAKNVPTLLNQQSVIIIGDYHIKIKTLDDVFKETADSSDEINVPSIELADDFFTGNAHEEVFGFVQEKNKQQKDIVSLLDTEKKVDAFQGNQILPDLDNIMGISDHNEEAQFDNNPLSTHVEPLVFEPIKEVKSVKEVETIPEVEAKTDSTQKSVHTTPTESNHKNESQLLQILALKFGIDFDTMSEKAQVAFVEQIADIAHTSLEQIVETQKSLHKIKNRLKISRQEEANNPFNTVGSYKELIHNMQKYPQPLSSYIKSTFYNVNTHNIAFYTAFKNISLNISQRFSPEKLYYSFEKNDLLDKSFSNKKALAWDAYSQKFKAFDTTADQGTLDVEELQKEYKRALDTINLGYNK